MVIREIMSRDVQIARPEETLQDAAATMVSIDAGFLPVGERDRLVGVITDRDIAVRAAANGLDPKTTKIRTVMTPDVKSCFDDEAADDVVQNMSALKVRRLPVLDRNMRLVGIVSLGDIARRVPTVLTAGEALREISQPGGQHSQTLERAEGVVTGS